MIETQNSALGCPSCKRSFGAINWVDETAATCRYCLAEFEVIRFPALSARRSAAKPQAVVLAEDSTCFFHAQNQADKVCDGCGRFLCVVCAVPSPGGALCPTCIAGQKEKETGIPHRLLPSSMAFLIAIGPMVLFPFWFMSIATAPAAIGVAIYAWKQPGSLVSGRSRWKCIAAILLGIGQIVFWVIFFTNLFKPHGR
jgi:hypothetical protein